MIINVLDRSYKKRCLLCYLTFPFTSDKDENSEHTNYWQSREIVHQLDQREYVVDVIHYLDNNSKLVGYYDCIIDILGGSCVDYWGNCTANTKKIVYFTGSNPSFTNQQVEKRLQGIKSRKGIVLENRLRTIEYDKEIISRFNAAMLIGNERVKSTYKNLYQGQIYLLSNNGIMYNKMISNSYRNAKKFLFIGSTNQVLKGLDLLLDVFVQNKDLELYICSPVENEKEFYMAYYKELNFYENIHYLGWQNMQGETFHNCIEMCAFLLHPSCSEGCPGSVLAAMSGGVIPVVTRESGLNDDEAIILENDESDYLNNTVRRLSSMSDMWIKEKSEYYKNIQCTRYSRESFTKSLKKAFDEIGV